MIAARKSVLGRSTMKISAQTSNGPHFKQGKSPGWSRKPFVLLLLGFVSMLSFYIQKPIGEKKITAAISSHHANTNPATYGAPSILNSVQNENVQFKRKAAHNTSETSQNRQPVHNVITPSKNHGAGSAHQYLVLGMHHSGTSILTMMLNAMGIYTGHRSELIMHPRNPLKFWELRSAVRLNQAIFQESRVPVEQGKSIDTRQYGTFLPWLGFNFTISNCPASFCDKQRNKIQRIVSSMSGPTSAPRRWAVKDPRMSLTASLWLAEFTAPACILLLRDPVESAHRMLGYNQAGKACYSLREWAAVWEVYTSESLSACYRSHSPVVLVQHRDLMLNTLVTLRHIRTTINALSATTHRELETIEVETLAKLLGTDFTVRHQEKENLTRHLLPEFRTFGSNYAQRMWSFLQTVKSGEVVPEELLSNLFDGPLQSDLWPRTDRHADEAYVTLLDSVSPTSLQSLRVLGTSIHKFDSTRDLVVLLSPSIHMDPDLHSKLRKLGWLPIEWPTDCTTNVVLPASHNSLFLQSVWQRYRIICFLPLSSIVLRPIHQAFNVIEPHRAYSDTLQHDGVLFVHRTVVLPAISVKSCEPKDLLAELLVSLSVVTSDLYPLKTCTLIKSSTACAMNNAAVARFSSIHGCPHPSTFSAAVVEPSEFGCAVEPYEEYLLLSMITARTSEFERAKPRNGASS